MNPPGWPGVIARVIARNGPSAPRCVLGAWRSTRRAEHGSGRVEGKEDPSKSLALPYFAAVLLGQIIGRISRGSSSSAKPVTCMLRCAPTVSTRTIRHLADLEHIMGNHAQSAQAGCRPHGCRAFSQFARISSFAPRIRTSIEALRSVPFS